MDILSSIELSREAKFFWLLLLPSVVIVYFFSTQAISTWEKLDERRDTLNRQLLECKKDSSSYDLFLRDYHMLYSKVNNEDAKYQLSVKIIEYENLKSLNEIETGQLQQEISEYNKEVINPIQQVAFFASTALLIGYVSIMLLAFLLKTQYVNTKIYSECQSCERTIDPNIMNFGTEKNDTLSRCFCNQCYMDGEFVEPSLTLEEVKTKARKEMIEKGIPLSVIDKKISRIYKLKRWVIASHY